VFRIEVRWGDGSGNPYLIQAAVLAAGIDGIENKLRKLSIGT
jgi:glutamine synthetase